MKDKQDIPMYHKDDGSFANSYDQVIPDSDHSPTEWSSEFSDFSVDTDDGYMMEYNHDYCILLYLLFDLDTSNNSRLNDSIYTSLLSNATVTLPLKRNQSSSESDSIKTRSKKRSRSSMKLAGVILHSALLSGHRVLFNCDIFKSCDPFDNSVAATQVEVPILLVLKHSVLYFIFMVQKIQSFLFQVE